MSRARDTAGIIQYNKISFDSNNAVGIGSSIPDTKLDVNGGVRVTGIVTASSFDGDFSGGATGDFSIEDKIVHTGDTDTAIRFPAADTFTVETGGSEALRITSNGDLMTGGITSGAGKVQVGGGLRIAGSATHTDTASPYLYRTSGEDNLCIATNSVERLRITAAGLVRISNTDVSVSTSADELIIGPNTPSGDRGITIVSGTDGTGNIFFSDTDTSGVGNRMGTIIYDHSGNFMRFSTNGNNERLRITSDGNVSIQNDSGKFTVGADDDLQIYHNSSNSYVDNTEVGHLYIRNTVDNKDIIIQSDNGSGSVANYIVCNGATGVTALYHYGTQKLATAADGVDFGGTGSIKVPVGTTAERPTGVAGDFRYNSDTGNFEGYTSAWGSIAGSGGSFNELDAALFN